MTSIPGPQDDPLTVQNPHDPVIDPNVEDDPQRHEHPADIERALDDEVDLETNPVHEEGPDGKQSQRR